jgi:2-polyprenyl-6-methoxyphenol hydroxylase-like FAD-dependent oxidoreductase
LVQQFDVAIFGAGPAALAVAARLLGLGREVALVDRPASGRPWRGESFSGAIRGPLVTLGFWDEFNSAGHIPGYERQSAWGGDAMRKLVDSPQRTHVARGSRSLRR